MARWEQMASAVYAVTRKWRITYVQDHDPGSDPGKRKCPHGEKPCVYNPDLDPAFYDYYKETCELISELLETKNTAYILDGEGILGLEAACASLTEPGDKVLVVDNGIYGKGFADFVTMYGGQVTFYESTYTQAVDVKEFRAFLEEHHDFKYGNTGSL